MTPVTAAIQPAPAMLAESHKVPSCGLTRGKRTLFIFVTCVLGLAAAIVILEVAMRVVTPKPAFSASLNLHMNLSAVLNPDLHGVSVPVRFTTNEWGMRGSRPPTGALWDYATTIITVGGSTTQCLFLDDSRTWPAVMEQELRGRGNNVWVGNAAQAGHSTRAHVRMVDEVVSRVKPDYVIFLVGINDLCLSLSPVWRWDDTMSDAILGRARGRPMNWLLDHSRLAYVLHNAKLIHLDGTLIQSSNFTVALPSEPTTGEEFVLPENVDGILPSLPLFQENVARLIRSVRAFGGRPIFLTQPLLIDDSPRWEGVRARSFWLKKERFPLTGASYARLLRRFNDVLLSTCAEHDVPCFDLAGEVPHSTDYYYDMVHYNDAGAELVGRLVAEHLDKGVLPTSLRNP